MSESEIQRKIRLRLGHEPGFAIWRNNVGEAEFVSPDGRVSHVVYGLCPGSSDLIGISSLFIQPQHVGRLIGRFVAIEVKGKLGKSTLKQTQFRELVNRLGGYAVEAKMLPQIEEFICKCRK